MGHGIETAEGYSLLHGECVALGMLPMVSPKVRERLLPVLESLNLPTRYGGDPETVISAMKHDKKCAGEEITVVRCEEVGAFEFRKIPFETLAREIREVLR